MTAVLPCTRPPGSAVLGLQCRECRRDYPVAAAHVCELCFGPLEVAYDHTLWARRVTRATIEAGPHTMWRYADLLPSGHDPATRVDLGAGMTRLVRARNLGGALGMTELWVKDDSANPTHSFKDRVVSVALSKAVELGFTTAACASTGNLANSVAAHAARAGLRAVVFIPADLEAGKVVATGIYGQTLVAVTGSYDDVNRLCAEVAGELPWGFVNVNLRAFYAEGSKTVGYEIAEQLGWRLPAQVVTPVASGSLMTKVDKAFRELVALGLVADSPYAIFGAQATGCAPVSIAWKTGRDVVRPVKPATIAKSLAIGNPADGPYALDVARRTGGAVEDVSDDEIVAGIRLLAETEGVFAETAGGVTVATLRRLLASGALRPDLPTVLLNTGDGLKTLDAVAAVAQPTHTISPSLEAFRASGAADHVPGGSLS
ncbi:MAG TPA: threonine synthase [Mycobacteriales bacterium]|nr:threonine synthase [Mycobacteriales bacterium]